MKKKKRVLKKPVLLIIIIGITIIIIFNINNKKNTKNNKYSFSENDIINKLSNDEKDIINSEEYNKNLVDILNSKDYKKENLKLYLKYTNKYSISYDIIISLVNKYGDKINDDIIKFALEKYFIFDNLDRYINYYNNNKDLSYSEVITRVNSKLDYKFYDDSEACDLSKGMYSLVNKFYYLDKDYVPLNLVTITGKYARDSAKLVDVAYENFVKMADSAFEDGLVIKITTGYRSYNFQSTLYNNYVRLDGIKNADTYSARPGYSEHQLGYSADLTNKDNVSFAQFDTTKEFKWLSENAYKYGFIMRYPKEKEYITGYVYESWHYRYVGVDIAKYIHDNNITYEEYYEYFLSK